MVKKKINPDLIYNIVVYTLLGILLVILMYPLIYVISASVTTANDVLTGKMILWPTSFSLAGYQKILSYREIWIGFANSIFYVVVGTVVSLIFTFTAAYPLSRKDFVAKGFIMKLYTVTLFFGGGLVPFYLLISNLGMIDTRLSMILPTAVSVWNIILARTYFLNTIPNELLEAAKIDGCSNVRFFWSVVLPLSKPIIAVMILYYAVAKWNGYFDAMIFLKDSNKYPLQLILRSLLINSQMDLIVGGGIGYGDDFIEKLNALESMKYGVIVIASIPMIVLCVFTHKYFQKGIMVGSLKG
ncbi:MAG: carbohydrate ABC transporter permease [Bacillales bacterium]|jgi:ABC-type glycerol-3-phosphate transport system permease component|nr:carbohydrate ABC transporter permease [Bacillales bacterium]